MNIEDIFQEYLKNPEASYILDSPISLPTNTYELLQKINQLPDGRWFILELLFQTESMSEKCFSFYAEEMIYAPDSIMSQALIQEFIRIAGFEKLEIWYQNRFKTSSNTLTRIGILSIFRHLNPLASKKYINSTKVEIRMSINFYFENGMFLKKRGNNLTDDLKSKKI